MKLDEEFMRFLNQNYGTFSTIIDIVYDFNKNHGNRILEIDLDKIEVTIRDFWGPETFRFDSLKEMLDWLKDTKSTFDILGPWSR